ncbi:MAG: hypothetical protein L0241_28265, partial [Planctomycetia bacterium]|nr:hypothetical protein [Planctomycetia bacterium]
MSRRSTWFIAFVGFVCGLLVVLSSGVGTVVAQPKAPPIVAAPQAPTLTTPANLGAKRGEEVELTLTGNNLADPVSVTISCPAKVTIPTDNKNGTEPGKLRVKVAVEASCPIGLYTIRVATKFGVSNMRPFIVDELPTTTEVANNKSKDTPQAITTPGVITGRTDVEASDFFKVKVTAGQKLTFEVLARRIGSPLDPIVVLHDAKTKRELVDLYADDSPGLQGDCRLTHTFKDAGEFLVEVRDTTFRGGQDFVYRLRIGEFPSATTAFPLAMQRGKPATIGFAGPGTADLKPQKLDSTGRGLTVIYVSPKSGKIGGWPVPVRLSDHPESAEQEPNDDSMKANTLPVPGGVSGRFDKTRDLDYFRITGKKGQKLTVSTMTYEVNSPAEVLVRVLDAKGAEVAKSNPALPVNRFDFTPAADGDYTLACEHQNFLHGPNEVYHLSVVPTAPDVSVTVGFDRGEATPGGGTAIVATVTRLNGFTGPVELSIAGEEGFSGKTTLPANQTVTFVPLLVAEDTKPGVYPFRVQAKITVAGKDVIRYATMTDAVKASLGGMPNPPLELLSQCVCAVVEKPQFTLTLKAEPEAFEKGKPGKILVEATRGKGADGDIVIAPVFFPPTAPPVVKPVPKGQTKAEIAVNVQPATPAGPTTYVFRATTKVGGKDYAYTLPPVVIKVGD